MLDGVKQRIAAGGMGVLGGIAVLGVLACRGPSKPAAQPPVVANRPAAPPPPAATGPMSDAEFEAAMQQALAMIVAMGAAADAAAGDCHALTAGLDRVFDANQPFIDVAGRWKDDPAQDARAEAWMKAHLEEVMPHLTKLATAARPCADDPAFRATMKRLEALK